jgi:4'-phosphopantetheinyl transferase
MILNEVFSEKYTKDKSNLLKRQKVEIFGGRIVSISGQTEELKKLLSAFEIERAGKFEFDIDRNAYILSHACLKKILSLKTGLKPEEITYSYSEFEKPFLQNGQVCFNLSHSKVFFVIALSGYLPVGIDTENFNREIDWKPVSRLYFTAGEIEWIESNSPTEQKKAFFTIWTRKEALLKAIGCGITNELNSIDVRNLQFTGGKKILSEAADQWFIHSYCYGDNIISLALPEDFYVEIHRDLG